MALTYNREEEYEESDVEDEEDDAEEDEVVDKEPAPRKCRMMFARLDFG